MDVELRYNNEEMINLLAIDATAIIISSITGFVSLASLIITLLIKGRVETVKKEMNGMKSELVEAVKGRAQAEGELKGAVDNQAVTDAKPQEKK